MNRRYLLFFVIILLMILAACQSEDDTQPAGETQPTAVATIVVADVDGSQETAVSGDEPINTDEENGVETAVEPTSEPEPTDVPPTATPVPAKELVICMASEPSSLYPYSDSSLAATAVRHALSENLYTTLDYAYQPQGLLKLPSLRDGDAVIQAVDVEEGELIVNSAGNVVPLLAGTQIVNAEGEIIIYNRRGEDDDPVQMQQMAVEFEFHPMTWSDGTPLTAEDSVFSFMLAADPNTLIDKTQVDRTATYEAVGEQTVRWTGRPGYLDPAYFTNVWMPLPRHLWEGIPAVEMLGLSGVDSMPVSSGPFVITDWNAGGQMVLHRNEHYYRAAEGFPIVDQVIIRFDADLSDPITAVTSGACDVVTQDGLELAQVPQLLAAGDQIQPYFQPNLIFEHIDFGVNSWNYGDDQHNGRPDWFEFIAVRQAIAQCIDRQQMIDELVYGQSSIMNAYIADEHPLYPVDAVQWTYDPTVANEALDEFGLEDTDGDGYREWVERDLGQTIVATTTFSITLGTSSESALRLRINEMVQEDLAQCGIQVNLYDVPAETWFDDGPFSPLFGRRFDMATFAWLTGIRPPCGLYLSTNVTGPEEQGFGGWGNVNATGWANEEYDAACQTALDSLPGTDDYESAHREAITIFTQRLPAIPLFQYVKTAVTAPTVYNLQPNSTQLSELWNLFELDIEQE